MNTLTNLLSKYEDNKEVKEILERLIDDKSYIDNHTDKSIIISNDTIVLIVTGKQRPENINVCIGTKSNIFCLNDVYLDNEHNVHLSRMSIGGNLDGRGDEERFLDAVKSYNETAMFSQIADFAFDCTK